MWRLVTYQISVSYQVHNSENCNSKNARDRHRFDWWFHNLAVSLKCPILFRATAEFKRGLLKKQTWRETSRFDSQLMRRRKLTLARLVYLAHCASLTNYYWGWPATPQPLPSTRKKSNVTSAEKSSQPLL